MCELISDACCLHVQNPDIVLVHYLNVPYPDDNKLVMASSISLWADKKEWTKEELISQLKPMCKCYPQPVNICHITLYTINALEL